MNGKPKNVTRRRGKLEGRKRLVRKLTPSLKMSDEETKRAEREAEEAEEQRLRSSTNSRAVASGQCSRMATD